MTEQADQMRRTHPTSRVTGLASVLLLTTLTLVALPGMAPAATGKAAIGALVVAEPFEEGDRPRQHRRWLRADRDRDGLVNRTETRRTLTNPRRADSDRDGLSDYIEVRITQTNPRRADSDGDGFGDGIEVFAGSDPWNRFSVPSLRPTVGQPSSLSSATENAQTPGAKLPPPPPPPSTYPDACDGEGAIVADTAGEVVSAVEDGDDVCIMADVGNLGLDDLGKREAIISTDGGSIGDIDLDGTTDLTISRARFESIELKGSHRTKLLGNTIGGTPSARVDDQLIFMPETNDDVRIEGNDIGWTVADDSGNTGYGCRCYGTLNRLRFVGNRVHDIAADGFQGVGGSDVLIDRNEIGPVGRNPGSSEHSDNIQITGNGDNLRITNNWLHHQGYYEGDPTANAGSTYIHGGESSSLFYENNLIEIARGRTEICGLGTPEDEPAKRTRSNIAIRGNTWIEGGLEFDDFPSFEWDCKNGSGNEVARNISIDPDGGFALGGSLSAASFSDNIWGEPGDVSFDSQGNCTSTKCTTSGGQPIGYREPSGVSW